MTSGVSDVRVRIPAHVMSSEMGGEAVLLNLDTETYLGLDDVGARMWAILSKTSSLEQTAEQLIREYEVPASQLRSDLRAFVEELKSHGLVEVDGDEHP